MPRPLQGDNKLAAHAGVGVHSHVIILSPEHEEKQKLETDSMYKLEHGVKDKEKLQRAAPSLSELQEAQSAWRDDFALNSLLRSKFRVSGSGWI